MFHPRTHLNLIFCAGALMTLQSVGAQNASSKIRFTNGLHGGVDIARSSMAMTDKHPLATDLGEDHYYIPPNFTQNFLAALFGLSEHNALTILESKTAPEYDATLKKLNSINSEAEREKLAKTFPFLNSLSIAEKMEISRILDKTRMLNFENDPKSKKRNAVFFQMDVILSFAFARIENQKRDPKNVNCLGFQTRVYGDETVHSLDYLYGNRHPSVDVGLQSFWGSSSGVGIGLRFPLFRLRGFFNDVDPYIDYSLPENSHEITDKASAEIEKRKFIEKIECNVKKEQDRYIKNIQHPTLAFVGGARTIDHIGQTYNAGVNFSILQELRKAGPSIEFLASTQYVWFHSRLQDAQGARVPSSDAVRFGLGFAINDRMVEFEEVKKSANVDENYPEEKRYNLKYWHWQAGAEYSFKNRLTEGDTVTGYLRNRDNGGNEYTIYGGVASQQGFFGFAFAKKFK